MKNNGLTHWLSPERSALHNRWRIAFGVLANLLALYFFQYQEHLWDIRDYRYVPINMTVVFLLAAVPAVVVLLLIPLIARGRTPQRWIGIALLILPAYFALAGWMQLLSVAMSTVLLERGTHFP